MDSPRRPSSPDIELSPPRLVTTASDNDSNHRSFNRGDFFTCSRVSETKISCISLAVIICVFGLLFVSVGFYGPENIWLGPNSSILVESSSIFVKSIEVKELDYSKSGLQLYGFNRSPPLNVLVNWSEPHLLSISQDSYKGWLYYLNKGSHLNISYRVKPQGSAVQLVVNKGMHGTSESLLNKDAFRETAWSWNLIQGNGMIELEISESSRYHLAVASLKRKDVKVELDIDVRAVLYDTKQSCYNCTFNDGECSYNSMSLVGNSVVITSPGPSQGVSIEDEWYIKLTYQPRCITYVTCVGMMICFTMVIIQCCNRLQCFDHVEYVYENDSTRTYLLREKDEDSSCDETFANDDADLEEFVGNDGEASRRLCVICFDAPRDCFFLPCGHCVSCYQCGTKIARTDGNCPICREKLKKVKRIYTA